MMGGVYTRTLRFYLFAHLDHYLFAHTSDPTDMERPHGSRSIGSMIIAGFIRSIRSLGLLFSIGFMFLSVLSILPKINCR